MPEERSVRIGDTTYQVIRGFGILNLGPFVGERPHAVRDHHRSLEGLPEQDEVFARGGDRYYRVRGRYYREFSNETSSSTITEVTADVFNEALAGPRDEPQSTDIYRENGRWFTLLGNAEIGNILQYRLQGSVWERRTPTSRLRRIENRAFHNARAEAFGADESIQALRVREGAGFDGGSDQRITCRPCAQTRLRAGIALREFEPITETDELLVCRYQHAGCAGDRNARVRGFLTFIPLSQLGRLRVLDENAWVTHARGGAAQTGPAATARALLEAYNLVEAGRQYQDYECCRRCALRHPAGEANCPAVHCTDCAGWHQPPACMPANRCDHCRWINNRERAYCANCGHPVNGSQAADEEVYEDEEED